MDPTATKAPSKPRVRLPFLYNLRAGLIAWVILGHAALTYSNFDNWYYQEAPVGDPLHTVFAALLGLGNFFGLGLFFLIAGLLTPASISRLGTRGYLRSRLIQLAVPVCGYFLLTPLLTYWGKEVMNGHPGSLHSFIKDILSFDTGPTWFLLVLLIYGGAFVAFRFVFPARRSGGGLSYKLIAFLILLITLSTFVVRLKFPLGQDLYLGIHIFQWPQFATLFALGCVAGERGWLHEIKPNIRRLCGIFGLIGGAGLGVLAVVSAGGQNAGSLEGGFRWQALVTASVEGVLAVGMGLWVFAFFQSHANWDGKWARNISPRAFGAFLIHTPLIVAVAIAMHSWAIPETGKFCLLAMIGVGGSYGIAILCHELLVVLRRRGLNASLVEQSAQMTPATRN
jgi:glucans biosynthesis protein C